VKYTAVVTDKDIERGMPQMGEHCPIARAIRRSLGQKVTVAAGAFCVVSFDPATKKTWYHGYQKLPSIAKEFVEAFDTGKPVQPISFEFELLSPETPPF
jgi:hypothetical protein